MPQIRIICEWLGIANSKVSPSDTYFPWPIISVAVATVGRKRTESIIQADLIPFHQKNLSHRSDCVSSSRMSIPQICAARNPKALAHNNKTWIQVCGSTYRAALSELIKDRQSRLD